MTKKTTTNPLVFTTPPKAVAYNWSSPTTWSYPDAEVHKVDDDGYEIRMKGYYRVVATSPINGTITADWVTSEDVLPTGPVFNEWGEEAP